MTKKVVPMVDLHAQYLKIRKDIDRAISSVIKDSAFIGGKYVTKFEQELADFLDAKYTVGLNSGTDALYLSLWALGIKDGDEVITSSFSFFATAEVIAKLGAKPVFVDIDPVTFNIDPAKIEKKISQKTKAIVPVHLFGQPADMKPIMVLAEKYKLFVVEDACQAIGSTYKSDNIGTIGDAGCFSFFPSKNLGAYGDGGAVVTNNASLAENIKKLRNHGSLIKYQNEEIGVNSRLDGLQAAILSTKMKHLRKWNLSRFKIAKTYNRLLKSIPDIILPQTSTENCIPVFHQYTIRVKNGRRDRLKDYLQSKGISTMIYYPIPIHLLQAMKYLGYKNSSLPETELASQEVLSLPVYPEITEKKIEFICRSILRFVSVQK